MTKKIDGIEIFSPDILPQHDDYDSSGLDNIYQAERNPFWFVHRSSIIFKVFNKYIPETAKIIEVGAGTGSVCRKLLAKGYDVSVGELHLNGLLYAKKYGIKHCYQFDLFTPPFSNKFDVVAMFDVLEHLKDDVLALNKISIMLKNEGTIVLTVPAGQWLWSHEDVLAHHKKRYSKSGLIETVKNAGFEVEHCSSFFIFLTPFLFIRKLLNPAKETIEEANSIGLKPPSIVNKLLGTICILDKCLGKLRNYVFGGEYYYCCP